MSSRLPIALLVVLFLTLPVIAKNKKKPNLPDLILKAQTVYVVIHPDAGSR